MVDAEPLGVESLWHTGGMETARALAVMMLDDGDEWQIRAGTLLIAPIALGSMSAKKLHAATGVPMNDINHMGFRFRRAGIWQPGGIMHYEWLDHILEGRELEGQIGFVLDVLVGTGELVKSPEGYRASRIGEGEGAPNPSSEGMPLRSTVVTRDRRPRKRLGSIGDLIPLDVLD